MEENTQVENNEEVLPTETETEQVPSQEEVDPVKAELERVESKPKRSKKEQLLYTKKRVEQQLKEMGEEVETEEASDEDRPLTLREFNRLSAEKALETAVTLADQIEDENERKLTQHYLENVIKPSGDAKTDLRNARLMVNAVKNGQIVEEVVRTNVKARTTSSSPSAPAKEKGREPELSKEDEQVARGFGLSSEEIKKAVQS